MDPSFNPFIIIHSSFPTFLCSLYILLSVSLFFASLSVSFSLSLSLSLCHSLTLLTSLSLWVVWLLTMASQQRWLLERVKHLLPSSLYISMRSLVRTLQSPNIIHFTIMTIALHFTFIKFQFLSLFVFEKVMLLIFTVLMFFLH